MEHAKGSNPTLRHSRWPRAAILGPLLVCLAGLTFWIFVGGAQQPAANRPIVARGALFDAPAPESQQGSSRTNTAAETANAASLPASPEQSAGDKAASLEQSSPSDATPDDALHTKTIPGQWHDEYRGKRHLTVRDDGTATMVVEPDSLGRMLFADKLTFRIEWQIRDGRIVMKTVGGEPEGKTKLVTKIYGDRAEYEIRELTADRMLLLDPDGKTEYDWRRP